MHQFKAAQKLFSIFLHVDSAVHSVDSFNSLYTKQKQKTKITTTTKVKKKKSAELQMDDINLEISVGIQP